MLKKIYRLNKKKDIDAVFDRGKFVKGSFISLKFQKTELGYPRVGFIIGQKISKKAVERNRIKRRLREAVSPYRHIKKGVDIVFLPSVEILAKNSKDIKEEVGKLLSKV